MTSMAQILIIHFVQQTESHIACCWSADAKAMQVTDGEQLVRAFSHGSHEDHNPD
jgi:hypothetical protein